MKKLLVACLAAAAVSTQATTIQWTKTNDSGTLSDLVSADGFYTGKVDLVTFNDGSADDANDALLGKFVLIDVNTDMFYITTSKTPATAASTAVFSGAFGFDVTAANLGTSAGYTLTNVLVSNSVNSAALTEFSDVLANYPNALYTFSMQGGYGNGQVGTVPEPASLGLLGVGLVGLAFAARRKKKA